ncbi:hypothetical protein BZG36_03508 [Bifiguratus adelaidae]|uniref:Uncharacterized protein n=1 Tax=Bifiguratus adelaidae TaxID=1938954 RepID=A0A261XY32_9FUNG|nr:hypothetical protein BZG36_03508 [Bifiguratus adelaidae]
MEEHTERPIPSPEQDFVTIENEHLEQEHPSTPTSVMSTSVQPAQPATAVQTEKEQLPQLQIVNEEQAFTADMPQYMAQWKLDQAGFNYNMVAVFGSQSTGKSTLLNRLFGTQFDVMDESRRQQTTKGIWISRGQGMNVLIMDVEGTDGRERGEDQDFERKSALFSLATSEVILVNLWEHQVGLYQGANMGLLKTVFEVNLQLFQAQKNQEKTLLLFVIRDHVGTTPLSNLQATLQTDLERIWYSLSKPEGLEDCKITDYFDFMYTTLPHKILMPEKFDDEVAKLRTRFTEPKDPNFVFQPNYSRRVPADGLHVYCSSIWEKIMSNKDLDLPTQQELLAQYRCDEIASAVLATFVGQFADLRRLLENGDVNADLGSIMSSARTEALKLFDKDASRYHPEVYKRKRQELLANANTQLFGYFSMQLRNAHKRAMQLFTDKLTTDLKGHSYNFVEVVKVTREKAIDYFVEVAKAIQLPETDWEFANEQQQLESEIEERAMEARTAELRKAEKQLEKQLERSIAEPISLALNQPSQDMWHKVIVIFRNAIEGGRDSLIQRAKSFNSSNDELDVAVLSMERRSWKLLRKKVDEETADAMLLLKLRTRFEEQFRYDDQGLPRVWKPEDDIDGHFQRARSETLQLLPLFSHIALKDEDADFSIANDENFDFGATLDILSEAKQREISTRFKRESDAFYLEAKRSVVATTAKVPYWVVVLLVVLGWNEFITIVTSPLYLMLFIIFGSTGYLIWGLNLTGPVMRVGHVVYNEGSRMIREKVTEGLDRAKDQDGTGRRYHLTDDQTADLKAMWRKAFEIYDAPCRKPNGTANGNGVAHSGSEGKSGGMLGGYFGKKKPVHDVEEDYVANGSVTASTEILDHYSGQQVKEALWTLCWAEHPDALLLRLLRARKWDVEKALLMGNNIMKWRLDNHVDEIIKMGEKGLRAKYEAANPGKGGKQWDYQMTSGKSYLSGPDRLDRTYTVINVHHHKKEDQPLDMLRRWTILIMETTRLYMAFPCETGSILFNMKQFALSNMDFEYVKFLISCFEAYYPECLGVCLLHGAPWVFGAVWKLIAPLLDPVVAQKVHFTHTNEDLHQFIAPENLPAEFGGTKNFKYIYEVPRDENGFADVPNKDELFAKKKQLEEEFEKVTREWATTMGSTPELDKERDELAKEHRKVVIALDPVVRADTHYHRKGYVRVENGRLIRDWQNGDGEVDLTERI